MSGNFDKETGPLKLTCFYFTFKRLLQYFW